MLNSSQLAI